MKSMLPPVKKLLAKNRGKNAFFESLGGNNGDTLIKVTSLMIIRQSGLKIIKSPEEADVIVINGGAKKDEWLKILKDYNKRYPEIPMIILPSSWLFASDEEITNLFENRKSPCYIYCREKYSLSLLEKMKLDKWVSIGTDHDIAFNIKGTDYIRELYKNNDEKFILIVERGDDDSVTNLQIPDTFTRRMIPKLLDRLPLRLRFSLSNIVFPLERFIFSKLRKREVSQTDFVKWAVSFVKCKHKNYQELPIYAADISLQTICSFKNYGLLIAQSAIVVTTRLHVAIIGALLGKPTYLIEGRWFKQKEVYEYSMKKMKNVKLLTLDSLFKG